MKRFLSFILIILLLLSLAACGAPASEPVAADAPGQESASELTAEQAEQVPPARSPVPPADEYERAIWYGFIPGELADAEPDSAATWAQYCAMLGSMISAYDESRLPEWERMTKNAPDTAMKRDGAMVALLFAAKTMGYARFNAEPPAAFNDYAGRVWDCATMDYPVFDWNTPVDLGEGCADNNHVGPAYDFCLRRASIISGKSLLEFDGNGDLRLEQPLSLREAALSAVRLYESELVNMEPEAVYISAGDAGGYDKSIITDELLAAPGDLPTPTRELLPAEWKGAGMSARKDGERPCIDFQESDVQFLSDNGFNFTRVFFGFSTLRYPDYPEDTTLVNENELRDLDQLIAWGIEYDVHIQLSMTDKPDGEETFDCGDAEWDALFAYWEMLARRYADIPSKYLSFDLDSEIEPSEESFDRAVAQMERIANGVWAISPERVLLCSYRDTPNTEWVEAMESIGLLSAVTRTALPVL